MSFSSLGLEAQVTSNLSYSTPTPIQEQAIPLILAGKDILGLAQTGTGKTAAFALPIIQKLTGSKSRNVKALIVAPTRELATQLKDSFAKYSEGTNLICTSIFGGVPMDRQIKRLKNGADIVIGCPGRILDLVRRKSLKFDNLQCLVLDEADQMFDMGFLPDIKRIVAAVPKERQTLLFSATMPEEISDLAHAVLTDPETIQIANQKPSSTISQTIFEVSPERKSELLVKLVGEFNINTAIVFARTKHRVQSLAKSLATSGFEVAELQGNLSHMRRKKAIEGFREGRFQFLVATDLASRGLDISELDFVINYDIPLTPDAYVHRIGRTGRAARDGQAFTFVSRPDEKMVRIIEKTLGNKIDRKVMEGFEQSADAPRTARSGSRSAGRSSDRRRSDRPERRSDRPGRSDRRSDRGDRPERSDRAGFRGKPRFSDRKPLEGADDSFRKNRSEENFSRKGSGDRPSGERHFRKFNDRGFRKDSFNKDSSKGFKRDDRRDFRNDRGDSGRKEGFRQKSDWNESRSTERKTDFTERRYQGDRSSRSFMHREERAAGRGNFAGGRPERNFRNRSDDRGPRSEGRPFNRDRKPTADRPRSAEGKSDKPWPRKEGGFQGSRGGSFGKRPSKPGFNKPRSGFGKRPGGFKDKPSRAE